MKGSASKAVVESYQLQTQKRLVERNYIVALAIAKGSNLAVVASLQRTEVAIVGMQVPQESQAVEQLP